MSLAYSPNGRILAVAKNRSATRISSDGTTGMPDTASRPPDVHLWDVADDMELMILAGHLGEVTSLDFSPDGKLLASASNDTTVLLWDATRFKARRVPPFERKPEELETLWADLGGSDAVNAYRAIRALTAAPKSSVAFLKRQLHPVAPADAKQVARLLADLDSEQFAVREKAMKELEKLGASAATELQRALDGKPALEVRRRVEQLLEKQNGVEHLRLVRALETLEAIGTTEARELCSVLADGVADAPLTREARATLQRMKR